MPKGNRPRPANARYSSFDAIGLNGEVHLRLEGETLDDPPTYEDARMTAVSGDPGKQVATFYVPSLGQSISGITEIQYTAWTRY